MYPLRIIRRKPFQMQDTADSGKSCTAKYTAKTSLSGNYTH